MNQTVALPSYAGATVVVPAPGSEPGYWSGAASAVLVDGVYWLTYRVRRPLREGRGVSVVIARSDDGEHFVTVGKVHRDTFGAESFERPVLVQRPDGRWRLYVSCATPNSSRPLIPILLIPASVEWSRMPHTNILPSAVHPV